MSTQSTDNIKELIARSMAALASQSDNTVVIEVDVLTAYAIVGTLQAGIAQAKQAEMDAVVLSAERFARALQISLTSLDEALGVTLELGWHRELDMTPSEYRASFLED